MTGLNNDNYESVFFKLLENEYDSGQRKALLAEINNDPFYAFEWECWQKTRLKDESKELAVTHKSFFDDIKSEADLFVTQPKKRIIPFYWKVSAIAACLFMAGTITFILTTHKTDSEVTSNDNLPNQIKNRPKTLTPDSFKQAEQKQVLTKKTDQLTLAKTWPVLEETLPDSFPLIKRETVDSTFIVKQLEVPILINSDTNIAVPKMTVVTPTSVYKRKFTVSASEAIRPEIILSLSDLEAKHENLVKFFDNKKITIVRKNRKLYLRLIEENESTILLSLK